MKQIKINKKKQKMYGDALLQLMQQKGGKLTPSQVLSEAKKKTCPYHDFFDWDDSVAGHQWRLQQARVLLGSIVETVIVDAKESTQRSFFNVTDAKTSERVYVTLKTAIKTKQYRNQIIDRLITHMENTTDLLKMFRDS